MRIAAAAATCGLTAVSSAATTIAGKRVVLMLA